MITKVMEGLLFFLIHTKMTILFGLFSALDKYIAIIEQLHKDEWDSVRMKLCARISSTMSKINNKFEQFVFTQIAYMYNINIYLLYGLHCLGHNDVGSASVCCWWYCRYQSIKFELVKSKCSWYLPIGVWVTFQKIIWNYLYR